MKIGIDIDEVLTEFVRGYLEFYNKLKGTHFKYEDMFCYDFWKVLGIPREEAFKIADDFYDSPEFDELKLVNGASEAVLALSKRNELTIITSRPSWLENKTRRFFMRHFPGVRVDLHFSGDIFKEQGKTKSELCKELGLGVFIDDSAKFAHECHAIGTRALLFERRWNSGENVSGVERVGGWKEILDKLGVEK